MTDGHEREAEPAAAVALFGDRIDLARRYADSLAAEGTLRGLIGPRETSRLWSRHLLNCAAAAEALPPAATVVDVGSGAGLPGIPMAIARADCVLILVEPLLRRTVYLAEVVAELGLTNVRVIRGRAEEAAADLGPTADVVTSRAVAPLGKLARWSVPLLRVGGLFLPLKGLSAAEEIERDAAELAATGLGPATVIPVGGDLLDETTFLVRAVLERRVAESRRAAPARRESSSGRGRRR